MMHSAVQMTHILHFYNCDILDLYFEIKKSMREKQAFELLWLKKEGKEEGLDIWGKAI